MQSLSLFSAQSAEALGLSAGSLFLISCVLALIVIVLLIAILVFAFSLPARALKIAEATKQAWRNDLSTAISQSNELLFNKVKPELISNQLSLERALSDSSRQNREESLKTMSSFQEQIARSIDQSDRRLENFAAEQTKKVDVLTQRLSQELQTITDKVDNNLKNLNQSNEAKLEKIRETVEEKLQSTLQSRLSESFKLVSEQLNEVYKGLGEMKELASDVGGLKRVLVNVKSRGVMGEIQLEALLSQYFTASQYIKNAHTAPDRPTKVVEFAIKFPGAANQECLLPIDSKFPVEDFQKLLNAQDEGDKEAVAKAREALRRNLIGEAKSISQYLQPPFTTDFAIMFLPSEALYAEALSIAGLVEELYSNSHVYVMGPSTLASALCAYRAGFQSLAIERRTGEIKSVLAAVKVEFGKFGSTIEQLRRQLEVASRTVDQVETRTRVMNKKLSHLDDENNGELELPVMDSSASIGYENK